MWKNRLYKNYDFPCVIVRDDVLEFNHAAAEVLKEQGLHLRLSTTSFLVIFEPCKRKMGDTRHCLDNPSWHGTLRFHKPVWMKLNPRPGVYQMYPYGTRFAIKRYEPLEMKGETSNEHGNRESVPQVR